MSWQGLKPGGTIIANSDGPKVDRWPDGAKVYTVPPYKSRTKVLGQTLSQPGDAGRFCCLPVVKST